MPKGKGYKTASITMPISLDVPEGFFIDLMLTHKKESHQKLNENELKKFDDELKSIFAHHLGSMRCNAYHQTTGERRQNFRALTEFARKFRKFASTMDIKTNEHKSLLMKNMQMLSKLKNCLDTETKALVYNYLSKFHRDITITNFWRKDLEAKDAIYHNQAFLKKLDLISNLNFEALVRAKFGLQPINKQSSAGNSTPNGTQQPELFHLIQRLIPIWDAVTGKSYRRILNKRSDETHTNFFAGYIDDCLYEIRELYFTIKECDASSGETIERSVPLVIPEYTESMINNIASKIKIKK